MYLEDEEDRFRIGFGRRCQFNLCDVLPNMDGIERSVCDVCWSFGLHVRPLPCSQFRVADYDRCALRVTVLTLCTTLVVSGEHGGVHHNRLLGHFWGTARGDGR